MDFGIVTERAAQDFDGAVGDDFISVHVEADAGAGLEDINYEFGVPFPFLYFLSRLNDRAGDFLVN